MEIKGRCRDVATGWQPDSTRNKTANARQSTFGKDEHCGHLLILRASITMSAFCASLYRVFDNRFLCNVESMECADSVGVMFIRLCADKC